MPPSAPSTTNKTLDFYQAAQNQLPGIDSSVTAAGDGFGSYLSSIFTGIMAVAGLLVLLYLIWGAIEWITAGGEKGKIEKARDKITQAIIGIIVLAATVAIFNVLQLFLGINVFNFGGGGASSGGGSGSSSSGGGGGSGSGTAGTTCPGGVGLGKTANDGGAGNYCENGGAAVVRCNASDAHLKYVHFDPCYCVGSNKERAGYDFGTC